MNNAARSLLGTVLFLCAVHPVTTLACAVVAPEDMPRLRQERIERTKADALALKDEADLVFVGTLSQLTFQRETVKDDSGREVVLQKHQAVFDRVDPIKGSYDKGQVLEYTVNKNRIVIGCGSRFRDNFPRENGATERYLVYARDGKILRTNLIPEHPQVLGGFEEALHLRDGG